MAKKTVTQINIDRKIWEDFKKCAKSQGTLLMVYLEKALQEKVNEKITSKLTGNQE